MADAEESECVYTEYDWALEFGMSLTDQAEKILNHLDWRAKAINRMTLAEEIAFNSREIMRLRRRYCEILRFGDPEVDKFINERRLEDLRKEYHAIVRLKLPDEYKKKMMAENLEKQRSCYDKLY
jgi:hypothetical protein